MSVLESMIREEERRPRTWEYVVWIWMAGRHGMAYAAKPRLF
jgi:hypothetical protein